MPRPTRLERRIRRDFPAPGAANGIVTALDRLPEEAGYGEEMLRSERVRAAIVLLANGDLSRFRSTLELAKTDWRDLLVAAGLAHGDWPTRLDEALRQGDDTRRGADDARVTEVVEVPGPEPDWEDALWLPHPDHGGKRNPARQHFTFEEAMGRYREIAALNVNITDIARRLRLMLEPGFADQLGAVDAAFFSIRRIGFAVHRYGSQEVTLVSLFQQDDIDAMAAIDNLLEALGVDWHAVTSVNFGDGRDPLFLEPVLDDDLRPTFPDIPDNAKRSGSGT